jgi:hypothetical protein
VSYRAISVELIFGNVIRETYGLDGEQFAASNVREDARHTVETVLASTKRHFGWNFERHFCRAHSPTSPSKARHQKWPRRREGPERLFRAGAWWKYHAIGLIMYPIPRNETPSFHIFRRGHRPGEIHLDRRPLHGYGKISSAD